MYSIKYFIISIFFLCIGNAQNFYSSAEVATAGAFLGGRMGTQSIHSNPALLGVKAGQITEVIPIDTFDISFRVKLASSKNEDDLAATFNLDGIGTDLPSIVLVSSIIENVLLIESICESVKSLISVIS